VKALLDTHALLWWLFDDPGLSRTAREVIASPDNTLLVSSASGWEISTKFRLGKLPEAGEAVHRLPGLLQTAQMQILPIGLEHALAAGLLPMHHRDPFDRMLIAQAQVEHLPIITSDAAFHRYDIDVIW
jgi:PIN domain nuclease of toxin-antitoxin system